MGWAFAGTRWLGEPHLEVKKPFVVPSEAPWAEEAWGMKLGNRVSKIRSREDYVKGHPERRAELDALGFAWSRNESPVAPSKT